MDIITSLKINLLKNIKHYIFISFLVLSSSAQAITTDLVVNGGFETGDFTGWNIVNTGSGAWNINDGTFDPPGDTTAAAPITGNFDAVSSQDGPGFHDLFQDILLPNSFSSIIFSWDDIIINQASTFSDPNQEWRVLIEDLAGALISEVFSTNPGDTNTGVTSRSFDLTALLQPLSGQAIRISFEEQDDLLFFNSTVDNVSLNVSTVPVPAAAWLFGSALLGFFGVSRRKSKLKSI